jgi:hypothetical protein
MGFINWKGIGETAARALPAQTLLPAPLLFQARLREGEEGNKVSVHAPAANPGGHQNGLWSL